MREQSGRGAPDGDPEAGQDGDEAAVASTEVPEDGSDQPGLARRLPDLVFGVAVLVTVAVVLLHLGRESWFLRDEWFLLTDQDGFPDLLEPNAGSHWVAVPRLVYWAFWHIWGLTTYRPYLAANLALHVTAVVMLRNLLRRSGVSPWLATAGALPMLLFGPGHEGILLAFQIGFTGSIAWGLVQLVLADVEGGFQRRDCLALAAGLLAITSSGVGLATTVMVGLALLVRRGWRMAAVQSVPLVTLYGGWLLLRGESYGQQRPPMSTLLEWDRAAVVGTFRALGHFAPVTWAYVAMIVVAVALVLGPWRDVPWRTAVRDFAIPVAMAVSMIAFATMTGISRWWAGVDGAVASRYLYLQAAFLLPLVVVSAQVIARRWRFLTPVLGALLVVPMPFTFGEFDSRGFSEGYFRHRKHVLTTAVRMPFADEVPPEVRPIPDPYDSDGLTIGYLLDAVEAGRLEPSTEELTPAVVNEFRVRLGFHQTTSTEGLREAECASTGSRDVSLDAGESILLRGRVSVRTIERGRATSPVVGFDASSAVGEVFTAELPNLELRITSAGGWPFRICDLE